MSHIWIFLTSATYFYFIIFQQSFPYIYYLRRNFSYLFQFSTFSSWSPLIFFYKKYLWILWINFVIRVACYLGSTLQKDVKYIAYPYGLTKLLVSVICVPEFQRITCKNQPTCFTYTILSLLGKWGLKRAPVWF